MQKQLQQLVEKEMSRKEFLATVGLGIASIMGLASALKMLSGKQENSKRDMGYGAAVYGGGKKR